VFGSDFGDSPENSKRFCHPNGTIKRQNVLVNLTPSDADGKVWPFFVSPTLFTSVGFEFVLVFPP
jgi:hypothetical protein